MKVKSTKQFKALIAAGMDEDAALAAYERAFGKAEVKVETVDPLQQLIDAGFSKAQAEKALADKAPAQPATSKEKGEALVADQNLTFSRGRVYFTPALIEAGVRVLKTGKPEIIPSSGVGRVKAVLVYREDSGDGAFQNLTDQ